MSQNTTFTALTPSTPARRHCRSKTGIDDHLPWARSASRGQQTFHVEPADSSQLFYIHLWLQGYSFWATSSIWCSKSHDKVSKRSPRHRAHLGSQLAVHSCKASKHLFLLEARSFSNQYKYRILGKEHINNARLYFFLRIKLLSIVFTAFRRKQQQGRACFLFQLAKELCSFLTWKACSWIHQINSNIPYKKHSESLMTNYCHIYCKTLRPQRTHHDATVLLQPTSSLPVESRQRQREIHPMSCPQPPGRHGATSALPNWHNLYLTGSELNCCSTFFPMNLSIQPD